MPVAVEQPAIAMVSQKFRSRFALFPCMGSSFVSAFVGASLAASLSFASRAIYYASFLNVPAFDSVGLT